uniref:Uncharacterized protein n=1 Tax=Anopheles farauti TaxID=69004 RepID=A0A182QWC6_9DIPT
MQHHPGSWYIPWGVPGMGLQKMLAVPFNPATAGFHQPQIAAAAPQQPQLTASQTQSQLTAINLNSVGVVPVRQKATPVSVPSNTLIMPMRKHRSVVKQAVAALHIARYDATHCIEDPDHHLERGRFWKENRLMAALFRWLFVPGWFCKQRRSALVLNGSNDGLPTAAIAQTGSVGAITSVCQKSKEPKSDLRRDAKAAVSLVSMLPFTTTLPSLLLLMVMIMPPPTPPPVINRFGAMDTSCKSLLTAWCDFGPVEQRCKVIFV